MKKIIFLLLGLLLVWPMTATAFRVSQPNCRVGDFLYLQKEFVTQDFSHKRVLVTVKVQIISDDVVQNHQSFLAMNKAIAVFSSVMREDGWSVSAWFPGSRMNVVDGVLTFHQDGSPKYINQLNGPPKVVYYNPKKGLRNYFMTVNQKINIRLSKAKLVPCQQRRNNRKHRKGCRR